MISFRICNFLAVFLGFRYTLAATVTYNWDLTWVLANPDGRLVRPVIGINNQWPLPTLRATVGDNVIVNVQNQLGNETASIHFHGLYQQGTVISDGPIGVVQCPIAPNGTFSYQFQINQPGTYWYHSHASGQYPDGLRGPLIIEDPNSPYAGQYDEELVLTVSDWYHDQMPYLLNSYLSHSKNPTGDEPIPYSAIFNDAQNTTFHFTPGKTYFVRIVSMAAFAATYITFDQHQMTIIEVDGIYTEKQTVDSIYITAAQRYGVLITAKSSNNRNYAFLGSFDLTMFNSLPAYLNPNVTGYMIYDSQKALPKPLIVSNFTTYDDINLVPQDREPRLGSADQTLTLGFEFETIDGQNRAVFNNVTYLTQKVPSLYTALSAGSQATNPIVYGINSNAYVLSHNSTVDIVLNNFDNGGHPFHLHGHAFQFLARSAINAGPYTGGSTSHFPSTPIRRDTVMVQAGGYVVLRFQANNPGVWFFHCHIDWHLEAGLAATMVEAPLELQRMQQSTSSLLKADFKTCADEGLPFEGNAAGNTKNFTDLTGANVRPAKDPMGALV